MTATGTPALRATVTDTDSDQITAKFRIFNDADQLLTTLESDPVASGETAAVTVPEDVLSANATFSFDAQASDGSLSSSVSPRSTFQVKPALTSIPAPTCTAPCTAVADQVLFDEVVPARTTRAVAVVVPGYEQGAVDRVQTTATISDWSAAGSVTIADADYAATDPASFAYGTDSPVTGTAEVYPSYDADAITIANNGDASARVRLVLNAVVPIDTATDAALDAAEDSVDDAAAETAIENDPSDYEDVEATTKLVTNSSRESMVQAEEAAVTEPRPQLRLGPARRTATPTLPVPASLVPVSPTAEDIAATKATLSDPPTSDVTGRVDPRFAQAVGTKCFENSSRWVSKTRFTGCRFEYWANIFRTVGRNSRTTGVAYFTVQRLLRTYWLTPRVTMAVRYVRSDKSWGTGTSLRDHP
ncbi:hypothetical protein [Nocardioides convexus]|uniref:hypothetical protein n=1 Tax=Nocardioides convexus TaxID=2712224 RepID=UPI0024187F84|nr:hypothetical protein [Nocardioides convexus]